MTPTDAEIARDLAPTGVLRASINLGNPVLAQGTPDEPSGVTVELAREVAARLELPVQFNCFDAARKSYAAMSEGHADLCFLAVDPDREKDVAFSTPYVHIEGVRGTSGRSIHLCRRRRPRRSTHRRQEGVRVRPLPESHPAPRHRGTR